jgi:hypothetical protein
MSGPERIWIDWKRANANYLAYDQRPNDPWDDCQYEYIRADFYDEKVDGMETELKSAVQVAYSRGAIEWTRLNYPAWFAEWETAK